MLSVNNNRELKGDNKIAVGLNLRQLICASVCGFILIIVYFNFHLAIEENMALAIILCLIGWYFGWHTNAGLNGEELILHRIKNMNENNVKRKYTTINQYVMMMNAFYIEKKKTTNKNQKKTKEPKKRSRITPIM